MTTEEVQTPERPRLLGVEPQFRVADLVATAEYYRDALGFELLGYFGDPPVFTQARRDRVVIQLGLASSSDGSTRPAAGIGCNAYLWVDDVDALAREYAGREIELEEGPVDRPYACRELIVRDCNGLRLCFGQDTSRKA